MKYHFDVLTPYLNKLDLLAWDCDGTLVDNETSALDQIREEIDVYWQKYASDNKFKAVSSCDISCARPLAGLSLKDIRMNYYDYTGVEFPESIDDNIIERRKRSPEPQEKVQAIAVFAACANFLCQQNIYQRIATGSEPSRAIRYIKSAGIEGSFNSVRQYLFSGHKPSPEAHRAARESLKKTPFGRAADPSRTIGIEDSLSGIGACVNDKIIPIGHTLASHISHKDKKDHAKKLINAGAIAVIQHPEDMVHVLHDVLKNLPERHSLTQIRQKRLPLNIMCG